MFTRSAICFCFIALMMPILVLSQHSISRQWNEVVLNGIRHDWARPTVHARNLYHTSVAMYDAWALYDERSKPHFMQNEVDGFDFSMPPVPDPINRQQAQEIAMSFAVYRIGLHRFKNSPRKEIALQGFYQQMIELGLDTAFKSTDYSTGNPAAVGNFIAQKIIAYGLQDGSNEKEDYANKHYQPENVPLVLDSFGNESLNDPNRWQPLTLTTFIDQSGNPVSKNTPEFLSPEWGNVSPFALLPSSKVVKIRDDDTFYVYYPPTAPPVLESSPLNADSFGFRWGFSLVALWSAHLNTADSVMWDISPKVMGNVQEEPNSGQEYLEYYDVDGTILFGSGHASNPHTGKPYASQIVPRGDFTRVLAEFWADGPDSETPPGHWFTILNYVNDQPQLIRRWQGEGPLLDPLEWDVKCYLTLGGAMHDCAIAAWSIKGWYDYIRPVSAIRYMASQGQCTDSQLPNYSVHGLPLIPGRIELIGPNDSLALTDSSLVNHIKVFAWKGHQYISNPDLDQAGVGWIPAEEWWPYQRPSFVTPPFAGFVSGHSTFSAGAAELLTRITGSSYFPGGIGEFDVQKNQFLVFEDGPSRSFKLQWATYQDAAHQSALSRIWGGIHPPMDDAPGRTIGRTVAGHAFTATIDLFNLDMDGDGYPYYLDCNDKDSRIHPGAQELCDNRDNDCDLEVDEGLFIHRMFLDADGDGFGDVSMVQVRCDTILAEGYVRDSSDCDDSNPAVYPLASDLPENGVDENCDGFDSIQPVTMVYIAKDRLLVVNIADSSNDSELFVHLISGELIQLERLHLGENKVFIAHRNALAVATLKSNEVELSSRMKMVLLP